ncbi:MAG: FhaA domain-containing protein, partial [Candidatus Limnocylindria bacterium]
RAPRGRPHPDGSGGRMIEKLESLASRVLEGWTARLFRVRLQPVQIAKRIIRAMESHQTISLSKTFVPNSYVVSLSLADYAQFEQYRRSLERDLAETVLGAARERNYTLLAFPTVEIERDEAVSAGDIQVSCALVDESGEEVAPDAPALGQAESGHTMVLDRDALLRDRPRAPRAYLHVPTERRRVALGPSPLSIGRDPDNDLVLDDRRVSRRHAEVRLRLGRYTLYDLQSTNGTFVNGRRIAEMVLSDGDRISVGGNEIVLKQEA